MYAFRRRLYDFSLCGIVLICVADFRRVMKVVKSEKIYFLKFGATDGTKRGMSFVA